MAKGRSRKGKGNNNEQTPTAIIALVVIVLAMGLIGGNASSGAGNADGGFFGGLFGNANTVTTQNANGTGTGSSTTDSSDTVSTDMDSDSNHNSSTDTVSGYPQGTYDATTWDENVYPNYVRDAGPAIVDTDVPEGGTIHYGGLDSLGRTQAAVGIITYKMYSDSKGWREKFGSDADNISGWGHNAKVAISMPNGKIYNGYMYNRSHLIADSLGGKAERENLVTGTRTQNVGANDGKGGMAYTETMARDWISSHQDGTIYYKVTPVYVGSELVPRSVYVDIKTSDGSIDKHVEVYNTAKGYTIDYMTGEFSKN